MPKALAAGTFFDRGGGPSGCGCDLAAAVSADGEGFVMLLRGNEDGTFAQVPGLSIPVDGNPTAVAKGRFDTRREGALDDVVVVTGTGTAPGQVFMFSPDPATGAYRRRMPAPPAPPDSWKVGKGPTAIATGDFNGDGHLDVAVASEADPAQPVTVLLGTGGGAFDAQPRTVTGIDGKPRSLAAGRFSGGGAADDIAVATIENVDSSGRVAVVVVPANGDGRFAAGGPLVVGERGSGDPWLAAANLSEPPTAESPGSWRDLVVAFRDRVAGQPQGRVKVLLGREGGGFLPEPGTLEIGASPQAVAVTDIDEDDVVDLMVSTHGELASTNDGTIRFFQGRTTPPAVGFHEKADWARIPETTGIRPRALAAGRFGRKGSDGSGPPSMGVAAIDAPNLNRISVFLGNGRGAFVQPTTVTTPLGANARLFVRGDFHSERGDSALDDVAYVSTSHDDRNVLSVLLGNGTGGFEVPPGGPSPMPVGVRPALIAAGAFDNDKLLDIAIVDAAPGDALGRPLLKVFTRAGRGAFKPRAGQSEFFLGAGETPVAIVTGRFRGPSAPLDMAVVASLPEAAPAGPRGVLRVLLNDGRGGFPDSQETRLAFVPEALVASDRLREDGHVDLIVKDASQGRFMHFVNLGNGEFRPGDLVDGAGPLGALLLGPVPDDDAPRTLDDVITYADDMSLSVFENAGPGGFIRHERVNPLGEGHRFDYPRYVRIGPSGLTLGLAAAAVTRAGARGVASLVVSDLDAPATFATTFSEFALATIPAGAGSTTTARTVFLTAAAIGRETIEGERVADVLAGTFRSGLHGNLQLDLAVVSETTTRELAAGACASDPREPPKPAPEAPPRPTILCPGILPDSPPGHPLFDGPCCRCPGKCPHTCERPDEPPPPPPQPPPPLLAFCESTKRYRSLIVYGNTCGE